MNPSPVTRILRFYVQKNTSGLSEEKFQNTHLEAEPAESGKTAQQLRKSPTVLSLIGLNKSRDFT